LQQLKTRRSSRSPPVAVAKPRSLSSKKRISSRSPRDRKSELGLEIFELMKKKVIKKSPRKSPPKMKQKLLKLHKVYSE